MSDPADNRRHSLKCFSSKSHCSTGLLIHCGDNEVVSPRVYPKTIRIVALVLVGIFLAVVVVTNSLSLGTYCLTTDAGNVPPAQQTAPAPHGR